MRYTTHSQTTGNDRTSLVLPLGSSGRLLGRALLQVGR
jgi:hypothetical protein